MLLFQYLRDTLYGLPFYLFRYGSYHVRILWRYNNCLLHHINCVGGRSVWCNLLPYFHNQKVLATVLLFVPLFILCLSLSLQWSILRIGTFDHMAIYTSKFLSASNRTSSFKVVVVIVVVIVDWRFSQLWTTWLFLSLDNKLRRLCYTALILLFIPAYNMGASQYQTFNH